MNRRNQILAGILVLQLIVVVVVFWPHRSAGTAGQLLFPDVDIAQVTGLTVTKSGSEPTEMDRGDTGWVLAGTDGFPVVSSTVTSALKQILAVSEDRLVATTASSQKRLKVAPDGYDRLVELELADGTQHRLYLGASPSYGTTYVRADDQKETYLASLKSSDLGTDASSWINTTYLTITKELVTGLTLTNSQGTFELEKSGDAWTMKGLAAGETFDTSRATTLLNSVGTLRMVQPLGKSEKPEYGMEQPQATLEVATADRTYLLKVGALSADGASYVVISSESPYFVRVSQYSLSNLVDQGRDWFLIKPTPVPTPEATASP